MKLGTLYPRETESDVSNRAGVFKGGEAPSSTESGAEREASRRIIPYADGAGSSRKELRGASELPNEAESRASIAKPNILDYRGLS